MARRPLIWGILFGLACSVSGQSPLRTGDGVSEVAYLRGNVGVRYSADLKSLYWVKRSSPDSTDYVWEYNLSTGEGRMLMDPRSYVAGWNDGDLTIVRNLSVVEDDRLLCEVGTVFRHGPGRAPTGQEELFAIEVGPESTVERIVTDGIRFFSGVEQSSRNRAVFVREWDREILVYDTNRGTMSRVPIPQGAVGWGSPEVTLGRTDQEIILARYPAEGEYRLQVTLFDMASGGVITDQSYSDLTHLPQRISLSPDSRYLALYHQAYGVWLIDMTTWAVIPLIKNPNYERYPWVLFQDWSWDSKSVLVDVESYVYSIHVDDLVRLHPQGVTLDKPRSR